MEGKKYVFYQSNKLKLKRKYNRLSFHFQTILLIILINLISTEIISEIHLVISGSGTQNLINDNFNILPSEVLVNEVKNDSCSKTCFLEGDINNVILKFENQIESCKEMFKGLQNIKEIDLSNFDTSNLKDMESMFHDCSNLEKINFGNINTSSQYFFS